MFNFSIVFIILALKRSYKLVTIFVALILYSASAWCLKQLNRLMNSKKKKKTLRDSSEWVEPKMIRFETYSVPKNQISPFQFMCPGFEPPHSPLEALYHSKLFSRLAIFPLLDIYWLFTYQAKSWGPTARSNW